MVKLMTVALQLPVKNPSNQTGDKLQCFLLSELCLEYTNVPRWNLHFFLIQCVPHNSTYRVFTHTVYYTIVSQSSTWELNTPFLLIHHEQRASERWDPEQRITPTPTSVVIKTSTCRKSMHMQPSIHWRKTKKTKTEAGATGHQLWSGCRRSGPW